MFGTQGACVFPEPGRSRPDKQLGNVMTRIGHTLSNLFKTALAALLVLGASIPQADAASRIKDIVEFEGVRDNQLVGYGLVVGLNGTGDDLADGHFTQQSLLAMLERLGVKPTAAGIDSDNIAAVMVTATLPPFAR